MTPVEQAIEKLNKRYKVEFNFEKGSQSDKFYDVYFIWNKGNKIIPILIDKPFNSVQLERMVEKRIKEKGYFN